MRFFPVFISVRNKDIYSAVQCGVVRIVRALMSGAHKQIALLSRAQRYLSTRALERARERLCLC